MMVEALYFYLFAAGLLGCALLSITVKNPVHAVLFLILGFLNAASLMIMMGAEFIGLMILIVYVGAIAVLFLFIIMMLDIDMTQLSKKKLSLSCKIISIAIAAAIAGLFAVVIKNSGLGATPAQAVVTPDNIHAIGNVLYTQYFYPFQISGIVLLAAMVGAVALAMRSDTKARRQDMFKQINTDKNKVVEIRKVGIGEGAE